MFMIDAVFRKVGTAGNVKYGIYTNTSNTLSGATQVAGVSFANTVLFALIRRTFGFKSATTMEEVALAGSNTYELSSSAAAVLVTTFDPTVDMYILFSSQLSNTGDTSTFSSANITLQR